jgi:hypothetical protein
MNNPTILVQDHEEFMVFFEPKPYGDGNCKNWHGRVYPVQRNGDGTLSFFNQGDWEFTQNQTKARVWFDFIGCWRGVWEFRLYPQQQEFMDDDIVIVAGLYKQIEQIVKDRIKSDNPDYGHFDA